MECERFRSGFSENVATPTEYFVGLAHDLLRSVWENPEWHWLIKVLSDGYYNCSRMGYTESPGVKLVLKLNKATNRPMSLLGEYLTFGHINSVPG